MKIPDDPEILWRAMNIAAVTIGPCDLLARPGCGFTAAEKEADAERNQVRADKEFIKYQERMAVTTKAVLNAFMTLREGGQL